MLAQAARPAACRCFLAGRTSSAGKKKMDCRVGAGSARGSSTHTAASPPREDEASASPSAAARGRSGEAVSLREWQGWGTSSPVPAMVTMVVDDLMALERETDAEMTFGGLGGKLQGNFKVQEDKKHREVYQSLTDSEMKLQFFAARQIACRLLGSRGYLCQKCWLAMEDCMCSKLLPCPLWCRIHFWLYMHPKEHDKKIFNFVLIDGTWSNSSAMYKRLKEHAKLLWGVDDLPCVSLSSLGVSVMHKLRPQPAWDRTCTAAAAIVLLSELHLHPELSSYGLDKQAEALDNALDVLLDALTNRRLRRGRSITRKERSNLV